MTNTNLPETECFNVLWKVKNFTYCCETIVSPDFNILGNLYAIRLLNPKSITVKWELCCRQREMRRLSQMPMQISILTCDGSPEESMKSDEEFMFSVAKNVIFGNRRNSFLPEDTLTVRWRILTTSDRGKVYIYSQIGVKSKYFLWTLPNFSNNEQNTIIYQGYSMSLDVEQSRGGTLFGLKLIDSSQYFSIEISREGSGTCYCMLKISVLDINGKELNCVVEEFAFEGKIMKFPLNLRKKKLNAFKTMLLPNDTLTLRCYFAVSVGKVTDETSITCFFKDVHAARSLWGDVNSVTKEAGEILKIFEEKSQSDNLPDLQSNLKSILDNGTLSDVSLQIGTEIIQAHKSILISRSPVFRAMFSKDMKETIDNTVVIEDLDVDTVLKFLFFLSKQLYFAADKYDVSSLKTKCVSRMETKFSISNVCEALVFADLHEDSRLKTAALEYISEYDAVIFSTEAWKEIEESNSALAFHGLREICSKKRIKLS